MNIDQAEAIAYDLIQEHCPLGWCYDWDRAKRRFGLCDYDRQTIRLSRPLTLLNDAATFRNVVKHEIAHVLTPDEADHGRAWKLEAIRLGCPPTRCTKVENSVEGKVTGTCSQRCGYVWTQHKITYSVYNHAVCPTCSDKRAKRWVYLNWTRDGRPLASPKKPKPRKKTRRSYAYQPATGS